MQQIKNLLAEQTEQTLSEANVTLDQLIHSSEFKRYVQERCDKFPFLAQAIDRFVFTIMPTRSRNENEFECIFTTDRYIETISTVEDLFVQFVHTSMHEYCQTLWPNCPVNKETFSPMELDVYEEIFGQAILTKYVPDIVPLFPLSIRIYLSYACIIPDERIERVLTLFQRPSEPSPVTWLYGVLDNAPDQILFSAFWIAIQQIDPELKSDIEYYYTIPEEQP